MRAYEYNTNPELMNSIDILASLYYSPLGESKTDKELSNIILNESIHLIDEGKYIW